MNPDEQDNTTIEESAVEGVDSAVNLSISADSTSIPEGNDGDTTTVGFNINLSQSLTEDLTLNITGSRSGNGSAQSSSRSLTIAAGETSTRLDIFDIQGDTTPEENETITASITGADEGVVFSQDPVTITVQDDDAGETADDLGETPDISNETPDDLGETPNVDGETEDGESTLETLGSNTVYRFFSPTLRVHFYTADENERDFVESELDDIYDFEGASFNTLDPLTGDEVYRFFNSQTNTHFYTTDETERDFIQDNSDIFTFEGTAFNAYETQVDGSIPVYRFFEPNIGVHFYTPNETEREFVENELDNYQSEGIAYYALPLDGETL